MKKRIDIYLVLVFSCLFARFNPAQAEDHLWMHGEINGQPAKFIFDTGSSGAFLFPEAAKRLGVKFQMRGNRESLSSLKAPTGISEECDFLFVGQTMRMRFGIVKIEDESLTQADGVIGWGAFTTNNVFFIEAGRSNVVLLKEIPEKTKKWKQFRLKPDSRITILEVSENGTTNSVLLDTGAEGGLFLPPEKWQAWKAGHPNQRLTFGVNYIPDAGVFLTEKAWAEKINVGPLVLKDVPIEEAHPLQMRSPAAAVASIGLWAMRQLQIVIDQKEGVAYMLALNRKPETYQHNRLGAVFIPDGPDNEDDLVAHVANGSPAQKAGIQNGDVLLKIDDLDATKWRTDSSSSVSKSWEKPKGTELRLTLKREKQTNEVTVRLETILGPETP